MQNNPKPDSAPKDLLDWLGLTDTPNWTRARALGAVVSVLLTLLFVLALVAAFTLLGRTLLPSAEAAGGNIGTGALIVALLGAPFLIWNTVIKHRALGFQKEGHLTDRISKAVEQLGAEKTVDRIGRAVTVWTGKPERFSCAEDMAERFLGKLRTKALGREWRDKWNEETDEVESGYDQSIATWPDERTVIEWQGEPLLLAADEAIGVEGAWQVFSESFPNIEVRIGGILSLERIAQDSTAYDRGRDHVRVMEILCAYVRGNAPSSAAATGPVSAENGWSRLEEKIKNANEMFRWTVGLGAPRLDIQITMKVLGQRTKAQREVEKSAVQYGDLGYCLDLSRTCLQKANLEGLNFANTNFFRARLEGAFASKTNFERANFVYASLTGMNGRGANFSSAKLDSCDFSHASLDFALFDFSSFSHTHFIRSQLEDARFHFVGSVLPHSTPVNRAFFIDCNLRSSLFHGEFGSAVIVHFNRGLEVSSHPVEKMAFRSNHTLGSLCTYELVQVSFGDGSVRLPDLIARPAHWPTAELSLEDFEIEWEKWRASPSTYSPPPPP